jgi:hypothetical protein
MFQRPLSLLRSIRAPAAALLCTPFVITTLVSCDARDAPVRGASDAPENVADAPPPEFAGVYRVKGRTVEIESGASREIMGLVILREEQDGYITNFDLSTGFKGKGNDPGISVEVVGRGTGRVAKDDTLRGTARTQLVRAAIPGVDARFALLPRIVGPRIVSSTVARIRPDGTLVVEIESTAEAGESYAATRTTVIGHRVGEIGNPLGTPVVGAGPPVEE